MCIGCWATKRLGGISRRGGVPRPLCVPGSRWSAESDHSHLQNIGKLLPLPASPRCTPLAAAEPQWFPQCEHHLLPFYGMAHVAYLPAEDGSQHRRLTVAQLEAVVAMYSKRLQIQVRGP